MTATATAAPSAIPEAVRSYIVASFLFGNDGGLKDDDSLLDAGALDSTGVVELVSFLEERFDIVIQDQDLVPENLDSISAIARFVARLQQSQASTSV
jgi:acyl carrier protein